MFSIITTTTTTSAVEHGGGGGGVRRLDSTSEHMEILDAVNDIDMVVDGILACLKCPYGEADLGDIPILRGQGCDGIDQDCDGVIDECEEDRTPPRIYLDGDLLSCNNNVNLSSNDPSEFVYLIIFFLYFFTNLRIEDDCYNQESFEWGIITPEGPDDFLASNYYEDFCLLVIFVEAFNADCEDGPVENYFTQPFFFFIDLIPPLVECGFYLPQDPFHVPHDGGYDPLSGEIPPFPDGEPLVIDPFYYKDKEFINVNFWYDIFDNKGLVDVKVTVESNEGEASADMVSLRPCRADKDCPEQVELFLATNSCREKKGSKKPYYGMGKGMSELCKPETNVKPRVYDITVEATDAAGNTGSSTCSVIVVPEGRYGENVNPCVLAPDSEALFDAYQNSKTRYTIAEQSLTWDADIFRFGGGIDNCIPDEDELPETCFTGPICPLAPAPASKGTKAPSAGKGTKAPSASKGRRVSSVGSGV